MPCSIPHIYKPIGAELSVEFYARLSTNRTSAFQATGFILLAHCSNVLKYEYIVILTWEKNPIQIKSYLFQQSSFFEKNVPCNDDEVNMMDSHLKLVCKKKKKMQTKLLEFFGCGLCLISWFNFFYSAYYLDWLNNLKC